MKYIILFLIPLFSFAQQDVPNKYWIQNDSGFNKVISSDAFGDDNENTVVIEFWAKFNEENCFADWNKIKNAKYYRVDIANAPKAKKQYRVRMAPTILIFKNGVVEESFKAGLDLELPADYQDIQEAINEINQANKF
tara:strand:- start:116 stop:526 length:411 start_codon:yes stop_codon:yes gene_type:complete